ncbi:GSCOCG00000985001-RA-CDS [Cotesia congregata]|nr:GSCOCG00000985001-RA-CDS [Cotesia congregata]
MLFANQLRVIKQVFKRMFGVLNNDKTPGPLRNLSSSLLVLDIVIRCFSFWVNDSGNSLPFTCAKVWRISLASLNRPLANSHRGDSGKNHQYPK